MKHPVFLVEKTCGVCILLTFSAWTTSLGHFSTPKDQNTEFAQSTREMQYLFEKLPNVGILIPPKLIVVSSTLKSGISAPPPAY